MTHETKLKFAEDVLDYGFNWTAFLAGLDTIASAQITATPTGLTVGGTDLNTGTSVAKALISGGAIGTTYQLVCRITTVGGLTANAAQSLVITETAR